MVQKSLAGGYDLIYLERQRGRDNDGQGIIVVL